MTNNYPDEFYDYVQNSGRIGTDYAMGLFDLGRKHAATTGDWHDLTAAIKAGEPIDWEKLDGRRVKCSHDEMGALTYFLEVDGEGQKVIWESKNNFWFTSDMRGGFADILSDSWYGKRDWTLYIDGPIPMKRKTADQLKPGTCIRNADGVLGIIYEDAEGIKGFWGADHKALLAEEVEVQTEYGIGTFQEQS